VVGHRPASVYADLVVTPSVPLLLVLDGNSLLHRAYHAAATGRLVDRDGQPVWALKGLIGYVARAAARLRPDAVLVGFDCPEHSVRKDEHPAYKAHRAAKPADLAEQLVAAPGLVRATGLATVLATAYEADDVLASAARQAAAAGWRTVLVTSDRDAFALLDEVTSVLRVRNGGLDEAVLVTAASLVDVCGVRPSQYPDFAALRGDPSDNLPGVRGFGSATAARLLAAFGTIEDAWAALDRGDEAAVRTVVGEHACRHLGAPAAREAVHRNRRLMRMHVDLSLPALDSTRLPLDLGAMRRALLAHGIHLGPSLWALTGGRRPVNEEELVFLRRPHRWTAGLRTRREPAPGQLALF
jgi:DNA polymerase-1